jgi:hypothetical protein
LVALAATGIIAAGGAATPAPAPAALQGVGVANVAAKTPKCIKWKKVRGKRVCSKRAAPAPAPVPLPKRGSYRAVTTQNATLTFDVVASDGGVALARVALAEIDETCQPGGWQWITSITLNGQVKVTAAGRFQLAIPVNYDGGKGTLTLTGIIDSLGRASGTITNSAAITSGGRSFSCDSGTVGWTGGTGAGVPQQPQHARPGHYAGTTSQGAAIHFDVVPSGTILLLQNLSIVEVDESCEPGQVSHADTDFSFPGFNGYVDASGHVRLRFFADDGSQPFQLDGLIDAAGRASGTFSDTATVDIDGKSYACKSGTQSWIATST